MINLMKRNSRNSQILDEMFSELFANYEIVFAGKTKKDKDASRASYIRDISKINNKAKQIGALGSLTGKKSVVNAIKSTTQMHKMVN